MTADELLQLPRDGWRHELVRGELRTMSPSDAQHSSIAALLIASLVTHVRVRRLGRVYASDGGFRIARDPDTVRAADAAFVRAERVVDTSGFFEGPPDAVFEIGDIEEKTRDWLRAGARAVVIVDPRTETAWIHRATGAVAVEEAIEIDDVIPGWKLPLAEIRA